MFAHELARDVSLKADTARSLGKRVCINFECKVVDILQGPRLLRRLSDEQAEDLLEEARTFSEQYGVSLTDYILWSVKI